MEPDVRDIQVASLGGGGDNQPRDKQEQILDAVIAVLGQGGVAAVSMRAVAKEAGVALGLMNYYFDDKTSLVAAALNRIGDLDAELVACDPDTSADEQLCHALRRVADPEFLQSDYLGLRLQLWSLAAVEPTFARSTTRLRFATATVSPL